MRATRFGTFLILTVAMGSLSSQQPGEDEKSPKTIAEFTDGMNQMPGFVDLYVDAEKDRIYLHIDSFGEELLYATAQASGLGSNPIGLDRGSLGPQHIITFHRAGPKVLVLAHNLRFRALSDNERERAAVAESFAPSVIASLPVKAHEDQAVVVDATEFFVRDATGAARKLGRGQGSYKVDKARSALWLDRTKAFPDNTEVEVLLTFTSDKPTDQVSRTAATGRAVTLRQHHSFIRLPDAGYRPRMFDPRVGYSGPQFMDYAAPIGESMHRHYIARHRLQKKDPTAALSDPVEPIVYYIDPGTPEPVRSALREGAMWWAEAFEEAGFRDAFRVEVLPADADPMDVRYNMIHWVHRSTRGWSYGASIRDPRTGEIIKGNVLLGSLRVRQDHLKLVGLQSPFAGSACAAAASPSADYLLPGDDEEALRVALARIRQLSAHEVGHTLGLSHNFAASTYGRASVMDYPAPLVTLNEDGEPDFSNAYDVGIGAYDIWAIVYGYMQFPEGSDDAEELDKIIRQGLASGFVFLTDQDARSSSTGHPLASLWDNGADPVDQLEQEIAVRAAGLRKFGIDALRRGDTMASLEDALVPLYLHHRFQLEAAIKVIGGVDFRHAVKGDDQTATQPIDPERQLRALDVVLSTLQPAFLRIDPRVVALIPPAPPGHPRSAERFPRNTGQMLDAVAMATVSADLTIGGLLQPQRAARLLHRGDGGALTFDGVLRRLQAAVFAEDLAAGRTEIERAVESVMTDRLMDLASDESAAAGVRAAAEVALVDLATRNNPLSASAAERNHASSLERRIQTFLNDPERNARRVPELATPPGSPIGSEQGQGRD